METNHHRVVPQIRRFLVWGPPDGENQHNDTEGTVTLHHGQRVQTVKGKLKEYMYE